MDFSNAYVDTEVDHINVWIQPQGLAEEAEVKVVYRAHTSDNDNTMSDCAREVRDKRNILSQNVKRCRRLVTTAISALYYLRSTKSNLLQAHVTVGHDYY
jgi:hypothetical protein